MYGLLYTIFFLIILLEASGLIFPATLIFLLLLFVFKKSEDVFLIAFIGGILLDMLQLKPIGITSIFFISFLFIVSLYDKKYEITTIWFVAIVTFLGTS